MKTGDFVKDITKVYQMRCIPFAKLQAFQAVCEKHKIPLHPNTDGPQTDEKKAGPPPGLMTTAGVAGASEATLEGEDA